MKAARRILAVDLGDARTGLAATDWTGTIQVPLGRLEIRDDAALAAAIAAVARDRDSEVIVLGMPMLADERQGQRAQRTEAFRDVLAAAVAPIPVATVDESHSTDEAHELLKQGGMKAAKRRELADSVAALVILQRYRSGLR